MTTNKTLNRPKPYAIIVKKPSHVIREIFIKGLRRDKGKEMTLPLKTQNLRHPNHLYHVLLANGQINLQKNVGTVPMLLIDPNGSSRIIQHTIEMMDMNKEMYTIQDPQQFSKTL